MQAGLCIVGLFVSASASGSVVRGADFSTSSPRKWYQVQRERARLRLVAVVG